MKIFGTDAAALKILIDDFSYCVDGNRSHPIFSTFLDVVDIY